MRCLSLCTLTSLEEGFGVGLSTLLLLSLFLEFALMWSQRRRFQGILLAGHRRFSLLRLVRHNLCCRTDLSETTGHEGTCIGLHLLWLGRGRDQKHVVDLFQF